MLQWIHMETSKLGFGVVIGRFYNGSDRRVTFVTVKCKGSGMYKSPLWKFKWDDTGARKCECPFKLCGYILSSKKWRFNVICGFHNHGMCEKLVEHPIACRLMSEEKEIISDMTLNMVQPKNKLATLKRKRLGNISNIR